MNSDAVQTTVKPYGRLPPAPPMEGASRLKDPGKVMSDPDRVLRLFDRIESFVEKLGFIVDATTGPTVASQGHGVDDLPAPSGVLPMLGHRAERLHRVLDVGDEALIRLSRAITLD